MAVPSSGTLSLLKIFSEKNENDYTANNADGESSFSLKGLSVNGTNDSSGGDISLNSSFASTASGGASLDDAPYSMSEFYGYDHDFVAFEWDNDTAGLGNAPFSVTDASSSLSTVAIFDFGLSFQSGSNRVRMRLQKSNGTGNGGMATASFITFADYDESDPNTVEAKCNWNGVFTGHETGSGDSFEPSNTSFGGNWTKNTYKQIGTSSSDGSSGFTTGRWQVKRGSSLGTAFYKANSATSGQDSPSWTVRAKDSSGNVLQESNSRTSNSSTFQLSATRQSFGGGGGGGFGGDICIHEDHLVHTEKGLMHIDEVREWDPKIYGYNKDTGKVELEDLINISIVSHDNLYKINNLMLTEDHIMYAEDYTPVSVNPELAKKNYGKDSRKIQLNDRLMKYDGGVEKVTSIERYEGVHRTYTIKTALDNFYADGVLVDSEI